MNARWSEDMVKSAVGMWNDTRMSSAQIAMKIGVSRNAMLGYAHRNKDLFPPRSQSEGGKAAKLLWDESQIVRAAEMWRHGHSYGEIGHALGLPRNRVINMKRSNEARFPERTVARNPSVPNVTTKSVAVVLSSPRLDCEPAAASPSGRYRHRPADGVSTVPFSALTAKTCAWPMVDFDDADGADMPCCGRPTPEDGSVLNRYCDHHRLLSGRRAA